MVDFIPAPKDKDSIVVVTPDHFVNMLQDRLSKKGKDMADFQQTLEHLGITPQTLLSGKKVMVVVTSILPEGKKDTVLLFGERKDELNIACTKAIRASSAEDLLNKPVHDMKVGVGIPHKLGTGTLHENGHRVEVASDIPQETHALIRAKIAVDVPYDKPARLSGYKGGSPRTPAQEITVNQIEL